MTCHNCGKACAIRSDGRRVVLYDKAVFFCNACPPTDTPAPPGRRGDRTCEVGYPAPGITYASSVRNCWMFSSVETINSLRGPKKAARP